MTVWREPEAQSVTGLRVGKVLPLRHVLPVGKAVEGLLGTCPGHAPCVLAFSVRDRSTPRLAVTAGPLFKVKSYHILPGSLGRVDPLSR